MSVDGKPKLIQISTSLDSRLGGPVDVVENTMNFLSKKNTENRLIIFGSYSVDISWVLTKSTFRNNRYGFFFGFVSKALRQELYTADILVIHGYYLYSTYLAIKHSKTNQIFLMPHGSLEEYQQSRSRIKKYLFESLIKIFLKKRKIHFIVGSTSEVTSIHSKFPHCAISVVGLGVDLEEIKAKVFHGQPQKPLNLICLSRISDKKRIDLAIMVCNQLIANGIDCTLNVVGSGDTYLTNSLQKLVRELQLEKVVTFSGFLKGAQKWEALKMSDVFLLPSENENFAVAVAESIAMGVPVLVSKNVAMHEFVDKYNVGVTIPELSVQDLFEGVLKILNGYENFMRNCELYRGRLAWDFVFESWEKVIYQRNSESVS
jgi:glycosyltransferase involved in cell wall biosynthesis